MPVYLPVWNSHCTWFRLTIIVSCCDELAVHTCPLLCLQRQVTKVTSGWFYCWSSLHKNSMATNPQRFTLYYGSRRFVAWDCWTHTSWQQMQRNSDMLIAVSHVLFLLCEKKHEWIYSNASTSLKNPLLVRVWPMCLSVKLHLCRIFSCSITSRGLVEYIYAGLWEYALIGRSSRIFSSDIWVNTECKAIFAVTSFHNSSARFAKPAWCSNSSKFVRSRVNLQICKLCGLCSKILLIDLHEIPGVYSSCF